MTCWESLVSSDDLGECVVLAVGAGTTRRVEEPAVPSRRTDAPHAREEGIGGGVVRNLIESTGSKLAVDCTDPLRELLRLATILHRAHEHREHFVVETSDEPCKCVSDDAICALVVRRDDAAETLGELDPSRHVPLDMEFAARAQHGRVGPQLDETSGDLLGIALAQVGKHLVDEVPHDALDPARKIDPARLCELEIAPVQRWWTRIGIVTIGLDVANSPRIAIVGLSAEDRGLATVVVRVATTLVDLVKFERVVTVIAHGQGLALGPIRGHDLAGASHRLAGSDDICSDGDRTTSVREAREQVLEALETLSCNRRPMAGGVVDRLTCTLAESLARGLRVR